MTEETHDKLIIDKKDFVPMSKKEREEIRKLWLDYKKTHKSKFDYFMYIGKVLKEEKDDMLDEMKKI